MKGLKFLQVKKCFRNRVLTTYEEYVINSSSFFLFQEKHTKFRTKELFNKFSHVDENNIMENMIEFQNDFNNEMENRIQQRFND